jgi:hypothetical protein
LAAKTGTAGRCGPRQTSWPASSLLAHGDQADPVNRAPLRGLANSRVSIGGQPVDVVGELGYNQGEIVSGHTRTLYCAGQTAMSGDGKPTMPATWRPLDAASPFR